MIVLAAVAVTVTFAALILAVGFVYFCREITIDPYDRDRN